MRISSADRARYLASVQRNALAASVPDLRDRVLIPRTDLPYQARLDRRVSAGQIDDQLSEGSCVTNAYTSGCESHLETALGDPVLGMQRTPHLSRLYPYYKGRELEGRLGDQGMSTRNGARVINHFGVPNESTWPYDLNYVNVPPSAEADAEAATQKIEAYERVFSAFRPSGSLMEQDKVRGIQAALLEGLPVVVAMALGQKFFDLVGPLHEQRYELIGQSNPFVGNHAMHAVGFFNDTIPSGLLCENSWGAAHGDEGYVLIPWHVIAQNAFEAWAIRSFKGVWIPAEVGIMLREITRYSVSVRIVPPAPVVTNVWVGARVEGAWRIKVGDGHWVPDGPQTRPYLEGIAIDRELNIDAIGFEEQIDLCNFEGTAIHVAYGESPGNWERAEVCTIPWVPRQ
jgi:hypothetical protein